MPPRVEALETRLCPTEIVTISVPSIAHMQVALVAPPALPDVSPLVQTITRDYLPLLSYYGAGAGSVDCYDAAVPFSTSPTDGQIQGYLAGRIAAGTLPAPAPNQVYLVVLPVGQRVTDTPGGGYHSAFAYSGPGFWPFPVTVPYAVVKSSYPDGTPYTPEIRANFISHELAETATDSIVGLGWHDSSTGAEVADVYDEDGVHSFLLGGYQLAQLSGPQGQVITAQTPYGAPAPGLSQSEQLWVWQDWLLREVDALWAWAVSVERGRS